MSSLDSNLTNDDFAILLDSVDTWETLGNQEFHALNMIKSMPFPPKNHESYGYVVAAKNHFKQREREILATREMRREKAIFLKAKLLMLRQDAGITKLFGGTSVVPEAATPQHLMIVPPSVNVYVPGEEEEEPELDGYLPGEEDDPEFDMFAQAPTEEDLDEIQDELDSADSAVVPKQPSHNAEDATDLALAEFFINDLGEKVWDFYTSFRADSGLPARPKPPTTKK